MKRNPTLGETLFDLNIGNAARKPRVQELTPVTVKTVTGGNTSPVRHRKGDTSQKRHTKSKHGNRKRNTAATINSTKPRKSGKTRERRLKYTQSYALSSPITASAGFHWRRCVRSNPFWLTPKSIHPQRKTPHQPRSVAAGWMAQLVSDY